MENKNKISKQKNTTNLIEPDANQERNIAQKTSDRRLDGANRRERDTPVFGGGEIFHNIFISSSRTRNIWHGKMLTHLFVGLTFDMEDSMMKIPYFSHHKAYEEMGNKSIYYLYRYYRSTIVLFLILAKIF